MVQSKPNEGSEKGSKSRPIVGNRPTIQVWNPNSPPPLTHIDDPLKDFQNDLVDSLQEEQRHLRKRVIELKKAVETSRKDNGILKMKATIYLGNMQLQMESLEEDKQCLLEKCEELERKVFLMRMVQVSKQHKRNALQVEVENRRTS
jgi:hypothetical protein